MKALTLRWPASARDAEAAVRAARGHAVPPVNGLLYRRLRAADGQLCGDYLFEDTGGLERFLGDPAMDPAAQVATRAAGSTPEIARTESTEADGPEQPIFIVAAPRAGGGLLLDLLAVSSRFWTIDGGAAALVDGVAGLHPADRRWESHRLTDEHASAEALRAIRAAVADERRRPGRATGEVRPAGADRPHLVDRASENALRVLFLAAAFPDARFVFLHRDARQNVSSLLDAWRRPDSTTIPSLPGWRLGAWHGPLPQRWRDYADAPLVDVAAFQWAASNQYALDDLEWLSRERWTIVDHAELVASPQRVVERVLTLAGTEMDEPLRAALGRPEPFGRPPSSPIKWRGNPEFREAALWPHNVLRGRLREYGGEPARPPVRRTGIRSPGFACYLDQLCIEPAAADPDWIVHPSYRLQLGASVPLEFARRTRFRERFVRDCPVVWVEDEPTRVLYPFWARREHAGVLRQLTPGARAPVVGLTIAAQLLAAGVLTTPLALAERRREAEDLVRHASPQLLARRYCVLPALLHADHVSALAAYYDSIIASGGWAFGDAQVSQRYGWHNEPVARFYHHQLAAFVGAVAGEPVRPSYCYVSAYRGGRASLRPHVDRKQCVYTVSLWIRGRGADPAEPWPLWLHSPDGIVSVTQSAADAVLFHGCDLPHWREQPPPGSASTTLIFHYVPNDFLGTLD